MRNPTIAKQVLIGKAGSGYAANRSPDRDQTLLFLH